MAWEEMRGGDRVRYCKKCELNVFNISALTREEALDLISEFEGRLCGRIYRRLDGTVITRDCPIGMRGQRPIPVPVKIAAMVLVLLIPVMTMIVNRDFRRFVSRYVPEPVAEWIEPGPSVTLGKLSPPDPPPPVPDDVEKE